MFQVVEAALLEALRAYFSLSALVSLVVFGTVGCALLIYQFLNRNRVVLPGITGLLLLSVALAHFIKQPELIAWVEGLQLGMRTPNPGHPPIPLFEPLAALLIGPLEYRSTAEEVLFVVLSTYVAVVAFEAIRSYRRTGIILGELSLRAIIGGEQHRPMRSKSNELGSADLASTEQIARWTRPKGKEDTALYLSEVRGSEGTAFKSAKLILPNENRNQHVLAIAKTGGGKTTKFILPILYSDCLCPNRSTIVLDSKPEMWQKLAAFTKKHNPQKRVVLFNPLDTVRSLSWNILSKIEDETDCKLIANTIIMATDQPSAKSDSPFFRNNALAILNAIMVGLLHDPNETLSMPRIHELVQSGMKPLCDWLEAHPQAYRTSRTFIELARSGSQNADTIMSELGMRLSAWDLPAIRATTSQSEFDPELLVAEPTLFIIELRESELEMLRPMANVIVVELLRFLTKRAESCPGVRLPRPVSFVIDEFASALGRLPEIDVKLNTLRSRNVSIVAAIQSIAQVKANYGDRADNVLAGFTTKVFIPNLDIQDSEWASKETGQMTIRFKTSSTGSNKKLTEVFASNNDSTQEQVQQRAVLTPDEIGRPSDNICTFFLPNTPVFQGHLIPWYQIPGMREHLNEFADAPELVIRAEPIKYEEQAPTPPAAAATSAPGAGGLPPGITNTSGWSEQQILDKLIEVKKALDWENTTGSARKWWEAFENENKQRMNLVLRLAEELAVRKATITEFFLAYVYSNTDNIQANLSYLDYTRLKKEEERKKREASGGGQAAA